MTKISCLPRAMIQKKLAERKQALIEQYRALCSNTTVDGKELSYNYAAAQRSYTKNDICMITLLETLLNSTPLDFYIEDEDAIIAFTRITKDK